MLQGGVSQAQTVAAAPTLKQQVQEVSSLSEQVDSLGQQYDELQNQLKQAKQQEQTAQKAEKTAQEAMAGNQQAVAELAAASYMGGAGNSTAQMFGSGDPGSFLAEAAGAQQVDNEAAERVINLQTEQQAAARAQATDEEEILSSKSLEAQAASKEATIHAKMVTLQSSALSAALSQFANTGTISNYVLPLATNLETKAVLEAATKIGDPYLWGGAGPDEFDCSGLVVWAYAQLGVSLPHYTGSLWDEGEHISYDDLQPGDLVFFGADIDHVGFYIGNGLMVDAPHSGADVRVEAIWWSQYVGAVRIA
jgi:cell wall-associated NlpC family hydrolase